MRADVLLLDASVQDERDWQGLLSRACSTGAECPLLSTGIPCGQRPVYRGMRPLISSETGDAAALRGQQAGIARRWPGAFPSGVKHNAGRPMWLLLRATGRLQLAPHPLRHRHIRLHTAAVHDAYEAHCRLGGVVRNSLTPCSARQPCHASPAHARETRPQSIGQAMSCLLRPDPKHCASSWCGHLPEQRRCRVGWPRWAPPRLLPLGWRC